MAHTLDGYVRVSRVAGREGDTFISPEVQRDKIAQWATLRGVTIAEWHTDLDKSGGKLQRPGLDAALERIRAGQTGGIAVARLDRFSRAGVADALKVVEEIHAAGGEIAAVDLGIDPTTPFGEFAMTMMLGLARMERRRIADNWSVAQEKAVERGIHIASRVPTGYVRGDDQRLHPHPVDGPVITQLFRRKASGATWGELVELLQTQGVVGPYKAPQWTQRAVSHIVANRVYLGEARSGRFVNRQAHEALTDEVTWRAAQRAKAPAPARGNDPALLAGLLRCAGCRHLLKPDQVKNRRGEVVRQYRCRGKHSSGTCDHRAAVLASVIEPFVIERFLREADVAAEVQGRDLSIWEARRDRAHSELLAFRDNESIAALGDVYTQGLVARTQAYREAERELEAERAKLRPDGLPDAMTLQGLWPELTVKDRRELIASVFDCIVLRSVGQRNVPIAGRTILVAKGEAPVDLPRRGRRVPLAPWPDDPGLPGAAAQDVGERALQV